MNHKHTPVTIRGVTYNSIKEAASRLGVSSQTISVARKRGTLDRVATGKSGRAPQPFECGGVCWRTRAAAAKCLGYTLSGLVRAYTAPEGSRSSKTLHDSVSAYGGWGLAQSRHEVLEQLKQLVSLALDEGYIDASPSGLGSRLEKELEFCLKQKGVRV